MRSIKAGKEKYLLVEPPGMISFQEKDLEQAPRSYRILPYRLTVNGENIQTGDQSGILHRNITYTPKITLKSIQNIFNIEYTTTDYIPFNKE